MRGKYLVILVLFVATCVYPLFSVNIRQNYSEASEIQKAQLESPVPWRVIKERKSGTKFFFRDLWVVVEETSTTKTANVFMKSGERTGNDLTLFFWSYIFSKTDGETVLSGFNPIRIERYFEGFYDPNIVYLPPSDYFNVYSDPLADEHGLKKFHEGIIGLNLTEDGEYGVILPWMRGAVTQVSKNPG